MHRDDDDDRDLNVNLRVTVNFTQDVSLDIKQLLTKLLLQQTHMHDILHGLMKKGGATQEELDALGARVQGETEAVKDFNATIPPAPPTQP